MRDVATRVLRHLLGLQEESDLRTLKEPCLIIAHDLAPSTTARLDTKKVLGFATEVGSRTSHTAILARKLGIPAVVGLGDITRRVHTGEHAMLDGYGGVLTVNPTDQTLFEYGQLKRRHVQLEERLHDLRDQPAVTLDGTRLTLSANIEDAADVPAVRDSGAEGVGLFRSEFLFLNRRGLPSEEEQFAAYREVAAALQPAPVVIRTLDLGGDKVMHPQHGSTELNPFLGWRAIRVCLSEQEMFRKQLRAILRASAHGNIKLMYPMISNLEELVAANAILDECRAELGRENVPFNADMEVGAMIEIPSAALIADSLARHVDFFSVGTNDLAQYTLAVDRLNERVAHLYHPSHPAIVRLIHTTVEAGHRHGCWVGVCGETAGEPAMIPLLLGLGVDELSATPTAVPRAKFLLRRLRFAEARTLAEFALHCESAAEILGRSESLARASAPGLFA
jgi:phosphotransferase system enzyme I (PtsI)